MNNLKSFSEFIKESLLIEAAEDEEFYVLIKHNGRKALVSLTRGHGNRWQENVESGDKIYGLGRNHIGNKADIIRNLKTNFDDVHEVSEDELLDLI